MRERERKPRAARPALKETGTSDVSQPVEAAKPVWDVAGVSDSLNLPAEELRDVVLGTGHRFALPEGEQNIAGDLDLYPERFLVRYRGKHLQFDLGSVVTVRAQQNQLRFEAGDDKARAVLFLDAMGSLTLTVAKQKRESVPATTPAPEMAASEELPEAASSPKSDEGQERVSEQTPAHPVPAEKLGRVVLTGRIGRAPQLRETPNKRLIGRMPLAVHDGEKTVWHNIMFFDEKAKKAAEELAKGDIVVVIGYRHTREVPTRTGMKQVEQIFAAAVQKPKTDNKPRS